jgi:nucleotidyltransferase/DNA polymerase involved in DNA repair
MPNQRRHVGPARRRVQAETGLPISIGVARTKHLAQIASQVAKPDGLVIVDPETGLNFLHDLPVELMWGVGPATKARLAEQGIHTIGQLAQMPGWSLQRVVCRAVGEKLSALAWNRDPRKIKTQRRSHSAGAQSPLGRKPAEEQVFRPTLRHLADRVATRLRARSRPGRAVTVRVRFADLRSVTRSVTLEAPISATAILPKSPRNWFARCWRITLTKRLSRFWQSPWRTWRATGTCSWNFRSVLKMRSAGQVLREGWRVGPPIAPLTRSATASDGRRLNMGRRWHFPARSPTSFASSPKRAFRRG